MYNFLARLSVTVFFLGLLNFACDSKLMIKLIWSNTYTEVEISNQEYSFFWFSNIYMSLELRVQMLCINKTSLRDRRCNHTHCTLSNVTPDTHTHCRGFFEGLKFCHKLKAHFSRKLLFFCHSLFIFRAVWTYLLEYLSKYVGLWNHLNTVFSLL